MLKNSFSYAFYFRLSVICFFIFSFQIYSQQPSYTQFTANNGLPSNNVYYVIQDRSGYFWFSTDKGLSRFDGYNFVTYTTADGVSDNEVFDIFEDSQKRIWFACLNGSLSYYDKGIFYNSNHELLNKINSPYTGLKVLEDRAHTVFYSTQKSIVKISNNFSVKEIVLPDDKANSTLIKRGNGEVISLNYDKESVYLENLTLNQRIKFSHDNKFVMPRINTKADMIEDNIFFSSYNKLVKKSFDDKKYQVLINFDNMIQFIRKNGDSKLWVGTQKGLFLFDCKLNKIERELFKESSISSVFVDNENHLWVTTLDDGVFLVVNNNIELINKNNGLDFDNSAYLKVIDTNQLFIGSTEFKCAVLKSDGIKNIQLSKSSGTGIIRRFQIDKTGNAYLVTPVSVVKLNKKHEIVENYLSAVKDIYIDEDDSLYVAKSKGISVIHANQLNIYKDTLDLFLHNHIRLNYSTNFFYKDIFNNVFCIGNQGIVPLNSSERIMEDAKFKNNISDLAETNDKVLFISSSINGIKVIYKKQAYYLTKENGLPSNFVTCLIADPDNTIWAGTTNGLVKIIYKIIDGKISFSNTIYNKTNGLISNAINDIVFFKNKLWISTEYGLCSFNKKQLVNTSKAPMLNFTSVAFNDSVFFPINEEVISSYDRNNLKITFCGISSGSLNNVKYSYRMNGLEENWNTTSSLQLQYPSLSPGNYLFEIKAININGFPSKIKQLKIKVTPAFYQTIVFKSCIALLLISIAGFIIFYRIKVWRRNHELRESLLVSENRRLELAKEEIDMQMKLLELEQKALRLHMNPHFIFNAINAINGFYVSGDSELGKKYITKLSQLLRMLLDYSTLKFISIQQEFELLDKYFVLNQLRFQNKFEYSIYIEPSINKDIVAIPPMIIQPFVENALIHGIAPLKGLGKIEVEIFIHNSCLVCVIRDNGIGRKKSAEINKGRIHNSTGIKVTEERIKSHFSSSSSEPNLLFEDLFDEKNNCIGTLVSFRLNLFDLF